MSEDRDRILKALEIDGVPVTSREFCDLAARTLLPTGKLLHALFAMVQRGELYFLEGGPSDESYFRLRLFVDDLEDQGTQAYAEAATGPAAATPRSFRFLNGLPHDFDCPRLLPENRQGNTTICCKAEADRLKAAVLESHDPFCPRNEPDYHPSPDLACCVSRGVQIAVAALPLDKVTPPPLRVQGDPLHDLDCPRNRPGTSPNYTICCKAEADRQKAAGV